jgi:hypothetical protein
VRADIPYRGYERQAMRRLLAMVVGGQGMKHFMDLLTHYYWNVDKHGYLNALFPEWIAGDPNDYYVGKWYDFQNNPLRAYMKLDSYRQKRLIQVIEDGHL